MLRLVSLVVALAFVGIPSVSQEANETGREMLQEVVWHEDDSVVDALVDFVPEARKRLTIEAEFTRLLANLDTSDTYAIRRRMDEVLRETPDERAVEMLAAIVAKRVEHRLSESEPLAQDGSPRVTASLTEQLEEPRESSQALAILGGTIAADRVCPANRVEVWVDITVWCLCLDHEFPYPDGSCPSYMGPPPM